MIPLGSERTPTIDMLMGDRNIQQADKYLDEIIQATGYTTSLHATPHQHTANIHHTTHHSHLYDTQVHNESHETRE